MIKCSSGPGVVVKVKRWTANWTSRRSDAQDKERLTLVRRIFSLEDLSIVYFVQNILPPLVGTKSHVFPKINFEGSPNLEKRFDLSYFLGSCLCHSWPNEGGWGGGNQLINCTSKPNKYIFSWDLFSEAIHKKNECSNMMLIYEVMSYYWEQGRLLFQYSSSWGERQLLYVMFNFVYHIFLQITTLD